ncbi:hypothetical protein SISNIDRAFT_490910 [Sistotremastrum niveocremeum HHB9708]|uniref:Uncharacterized protein n=1 Tax=Sistotremastrum niveocremeum HHB9708 TaxID=1314777 RepID=A0A164NBQ3_9AGAM|nr:hypothetical protein SISNIDRAFT_490910 [Sistotremastrum niveocremeum HHB9708]
MAPESSTRATQKVTLNVNTTTKKGRTASKNLPAPVLEQRNELKNAADDALRQAIEKIYDGLETDLSALAIEHSMSPEDMWRNFLGMTGKLRQTRKTWIERKKLIALAKEGKEQPWLELSLAEQEKLKQDLRDYRKEKAIEGSLSGGSVTKLVRSKGAAICAELNTLRVQANVHALLIILKGDESQTFEPIMHYTTEMNAYMLANKLEITKLFLKMQGYLISGMPAVEEKVNLSGKNVNVLKQTLRQKLHNILREVSGVQIQKVEYANAELQERTLKVKMIGWRWGELRNPSDISSMETLKEMLGDIEAKKFGWRKMTADEIAEASRNPVRRRKRSDKENVPPTTTDPSSASGTPSIESASKDANAKTPSTESHSTDASAKTSSLRPPSPSQAIPPSHEAHSAPIAPSPPALDVDSSLSTDILTPNNTPGIDPFSFLDDFPLPDPNVSSNAGVVGMMETGSMVAGDKCSWESAGLGALETSHDAQVPRLDTSLDVHSFGDFTSLLHASDEELPPEILQDSQLQALMAELAAGMGTGMPTAF